jgi:SAM-dependent methyltransferase
MSEARTAPAVARNRDPILAVLRRYMPEKGTVLEIAAGTGEHAVHFAAAFPDLSWQPTDPDEGALASIAAWRDRAGVLNLLPPLRLDVTVPPWPVDWADAVVCINMIHISPWRATEALIAGTAKVLAPSGVLFLYGPYKEGGRHTAPSNEAFDADLRARNPEWGVRDLDTVRALAERYGLAFEERVAMPSNNLSVIFRRR